MSSASLGANSTAKSRLNSIKDLEKSNSTINAFIGGRQRAWMIGQAAAIQQNKPNIAMSNPGSLNQASEPHPGTAMTPELSTTIRTNDLSTESFGSHFDGNQYPTQRQRCENTDNYSNISSTSRPVQPTPPAISPEFSTDMSGTPLVASMELPKNVDNLLPSPSPSVEPRNHSGRTMDLDQVGQEGQVTTAQSKPELVEVIAKYGTLENLERRLQDVEKPNAAADRIAIMKGPKILSDSPRRGRCVLFWSHFSHCRQCFGL